jgi:hypothetical protein
MKISFWFAAASSMLISTGVTAATTAGADDSNLEATGNLRALKKAPKVDVCKIPPDDPTNWRTISVNANALKAQLAGGSLEGDCFDHCEFLCDDDDKCTIDDCGSNMGECVSSPVTCPSGTECDGNTGKCCVTVESSVLNYSGQGWAGWSCPNSLTISDCTAVALDTIPTFEAGSITLWKEGASVGTVTYPATPFGYTYTPPEEGCLVQAQAPGSAQIILTCCVAEEE